MAQENFVVYTAEMDNIIKEEAKKSPKNLAASFRASVERIKSELGEQNVTPEKIKARFYLKHNKRKANGNGNGNGAEAKAKTSRNGKKTAPSSGSAKTVKTVENNTNVTEEVTDEKYLLVRDFVASLPMDKKLKLVKELWAGI